MGPYERISYLYTQLRPSNIRQLIPLQRRPFLPPVALHGEHSHQIFVHGRAHLPHEQRSAVADGSQVVRAQKVRPPRLRRTFPVGRLAKFRWDVVQRIRRRVLAPCIRGIFVHTFVSQGMHAGIALQRAVLVQTGDGALEFRRIHQHGREERFVRHEHPGLDQGFLQHAPQTVGMVHAPYHVLHEVVGQGHPLAAEVDGSLDIPPPPARDGIDVAQLLGNILLEVMRALHGMFGKVVYRRGEQSRYAGCGRDEVRVSQRAAFGFE
mmetsp:Transcript_20911/g.50343  ORF Transcript_20911/g.50343 Transcript_20911/m.50343 type:complete len:265 (-) Transcript_20911:114-908(-)